ACPEAKQLRACPEAKQLRACPEAKQLRRKARRCVSLRLKFKASRTQANSLVFGLNIGVAFLLIT
ncbi:hypothetical protein, partial [Cyclobacterium amurskyense]|uniref:hypothetical protein n=1 Tax=Cyclobacterium amurskyense TaxID=320787 RepID=UPI0030DD5AC8